MKLKDPLKIVLAVLVCQAVGALGGMITAKQIPTWYATLAKPSFTPPSWLFGPVWILLYTFMGIAVYLVLRKSWASPHIRLAVYLFAVQLIMNGFWTPLFFGLHLLLVAFIEIVVLWILILITIRLFFRLNRAAGLLLVPYLIWVGYASALNLAFWLLNR